MLLLAVQLTAYADRDGGGMISGKIISDGKQPVSFATVMLKGTAHGAHTDSRGIYHITAPAGRYSLVVSAVGYKTIEREVTVKAGLRQQIDFNIKEDGL